MAEAAVKKTLRHPGKELAEKISSLKMIDSELADRGNLSRPLVSQITNGNRRITPASATKICSVIGGDPMYWVKLQREYDAWVEEEELTARNSINQAVRELVGS